MSAAFHIHADPAFQHVDLSLNLQASAVAGSKIFSAPFSVKTLTPVVNYMTTGPGMRPYFRSGQSGHIQLSLTAPAPTGGTPVALSTSGTRLTVPPM